VCSHVTRLGAIDKKGQENISSWKTNFRALAESEGLWEHFTTDLSRYAKPPKKSTFVQSASREVKALGTDVPDSHDELGHRLAIKEA